MVQGTVTISLSSSTMSTKVGPETTHLPENRGEDAEQNWYGKSSRVFAKLVDLCGPFWFIHPPAGQAPVCLTQGQLRRMGAGPWPQGRAEAAEGGRRRSQSRFCHFLAG